MNTETQLATIALEDSTPESLATYASTQLGLLRSEFEAVKQTTDQAHQRAWEIGRACVHLKDHHMPNQEQWELFAKDAIGGGEYLPVYRAMRLFRMSPDKPPGRTAAAAKQLLIMFGDEPMPKWTPRKSDVKKFANMKACASGLQRWWREGDAIKGLDVETLREIEEDLRPLHAIRLAVMAAIIREGD